MKRAQSDDQKDQRRKAILDQARQALLGNDYRDIRLQDLATGLGLVKGTLYRYFPTKQDLFMALYREELEAWFDSWKDDPGIVTPDGLERALTDSLDARPLLVRLIGSFHAELEPELSDEGLLQFKFFLREYLLKVSEGIGGGNLDRAGRAMQLMITIYALIQGLSPLCFPVRRIVAILDSEPDLALFRFDFRTLFARSLHTLIESILEE